MKTITCIVTYTSVCKLFCLPVVLTQKPAVSRYCSHCFMENKRSFKIDKTLPGVTQYGIFTWFTLSNRSYAAPLIKEDRCLNVYQRPFCKAFMISSRKH